MRIAAVAAATAVALATSVPALAAPDGGARIAPESSPAAPSEDEPDKSEAAAVGLSLGGGLVAPALFAFSASWTRPELLVLGLGSMVALPSLGHWYAGQVDGAQIAVRAAGLAGILAAAAVFEAEDCNDLPPLPGPCRGPESAALVPLTVGSVAIVVSTVYSIVTARNAAQHHHASAFTVAPWVEHSGGRRTGLAFSGSF
jgi:hypothetical protein